MKQASLLINYVITMKAGKSGVIFVGNKSVTISVGTTSSAAPSVTGVNVVDGTDGYTPVTVPTVGQVIRANINLSDGTTIGTYPVNNNAIYKWYYKDSPDTILGTTSSFTVTSDNIGKIICVNVSITGDTGMATWTANGVVAQKLSNQISYYTGISFKKSVTPIVESISGTSVNQKVNADGSIGITVSSPAYTYIDSGFVMNIGTLGSISSIKLQGSGDYGLNLYFDVDKDGSFFNWNQNGTFSGVGNDAYALYEGPYGNDITINNISQFGLQSQPSGSQYLYTLSQLKTKYAADTPVGIWVGVTKGSNEATLSKSATINSVTLTQ